ncbi:MAG TPA: shikimate kinase [Alphaproteobacteria bacterium]|nr:shikimate kinase [Alphaproteobacteria bacterium]
MLVCKYGENTSHPCEAAVNSSGSALPSDADDARQPRGREAASTRAIAQRLDKTIVLVGLMGAGKSCIGKRLAAALGLPFVDADREIEAAAGGCSISDIFALHGEKVFRDGERRVIQRLLGNPVHVLATGGGAFMDPSTRALVKEKALSVWLKAELEQLLKRVGRRNDRPLLRDVDPRQKLTELMEARYPVYAEADLTVESADGPPDITVQRVLRAIEAELDRAGNRADRAHQP